MLGLRSAAFHLFMALATPVYAILVLLAFWVPPVPRLQFIRGWCLLVLNAARLLCGIRYQVIGREHIPRTPHLILCKHSSTWETLALNDLFPPQSFVAKRELLWVPFFGWAFALASPITIDRSLGAKAMQKMIEQGRERLARGFWITIFPEGTRIPVHRRVKYKTGGARLAVGLDLPILPVAHNAGYLWPRRKFLLHPGTVTVSVGEPIDPRGRTADTITAEVERWVESEVARLGDPREKAARRSARAATSGTRAAR